jgi:23S rRNA pseudouridine1911/1915/1917 synthase
VAPEPDAPEEPLDEGPDGAQTVSVEIAPQEARGRIDRFLAERVPELSRARLQALIAAGKVRRDGAVLTDSSARAAAGSYVVEIPPPEPAEPQPEPISLAVLYEDADLIVVDKPAGMAVHPAPGSASGTLVNALLAHCGASLSGVGGVARPGIVHRIDKETSGVVVAAKTDRAHRGLSALFAAHDIERVYVALVRGAPSDRRGTIEGAIGRSPRDRKKMAVVRSGGRAALTRYRVETVFGDASRPLAARLACTLETGRTHQIRVHLASIGCPCLADPLYGSGPPAEPVRRAIAQAGLRRQALHAAVLGFRHPTSGAALRFESRPPADMARLEALLQTL